MQFNTISRNNSTFYSSIKQKCFQSVAIYELQYSTVLSFCFDKKCVSKRLAWQPYSHDHKRRHGHENSDFARHTWFDRIWSIYSTCIVENKCYIPTCGADSTLCSWAASCSQSSEYALIKNNIKLGNSEGSGAKLYMTNDLLIWWKYLCISSYIRKPFLIYDFAPDPIWISIYIRKI